MIIIMFGDLSDALPNHLEEIFIFGFIQVDGWDIQTPYVCPASSPRTLVTLMRVTCV